MTANKSTESSQGDGGGGPPPPPHSGQTDQLESRNSNMVFKSGPLFISSKGIGWTSWKKRWFILTQTSLVFFRSDPNAVPQKGGEVNLTLGGIDLNNSGSVVVKADKKLLTVLFPDGRDGRTFTLKAETTEDLYEWKTALENALAQAPNTAAVMGQNGILKNEQADGTDGSAEKPKEKPPAKSLIIGRPILLALEDVDGSPSFLEKALKFIEEHGIKVEGILRQAADVDDVERRIREYEQGKTEFIQGEDAHVIADCIKYFLRELPSSPVPASCCNALLEACRIDRSKRVSAMRTAICETFPEPNRRLLQRILVMMQIVASHKTVNRMSTSAVAACMAPLLLRPLLAGDCEIETNIDVGGDSSIQLLKAAAAANHAQAILITLLEEYGTIFSEGSMSPGLYTDSEECESEGEVTDDDEYYEDDEEDDATEEGDAYTDDDLEDVSAGSYTGSDGSGEDELSVNKDGDDLSSGSKSSEVDNDCRAEQKSSSSVQTTLLPVGDGKRSEKVTDRSKSANVYGQLLEDESVKRTLESKQTSRNAPECIQKSATIANGPAESIKRPTVWGRTSARKDLSMESMDFPIEEEAELEQLEAAKLELQNKISEEVKGNAALQANLEQRRRAFDQRRLALEQEVARLQEQLQEERDKRKALEAALSATEKPLFVPSTIDEKMKADIEEVNQTEADITKLKEQVDDLNLQLNQQRGSSNCSLPDSRNQSINATNNQTKVKDKQKDVGGKSGSKDNSIDGAESKNKHESSLSNKHPPHNQQQGQTRRSNSSKSASTHSKKSSAKNEGVNSTSSALTKLTTRLNFLKERRNQIANELHNLDKTRASTQAVLNQDRGRALEDNPEKGFETEEQSLPNSDKSKKPDNQALKNQDDSEGHDPRILERGKSEGHVSYVAGSGDHPEATSRTNTR